MKRLLLPSLLLLAVACASAPVPPPAAAPSAPTATKEATGTCDDPIVIHAPNEEAGIRGESEWIRAHYGPFAKLGQGLLQCKGKIADSVDFTTVNGTKHTIYFDISEWFGKY
jgi:hypothetical protein